jgi:hypothetical protein
MAARTRAPQRCDRDAFRPYVSSKEGTTMKNRIASGTFRALILLSALASSGLVLEAARRW